MMNGSNGKQLVAAVLTGLTVACSGLGHAAETVDTNVTVKVNVQQQQTETKGAVNWEKGVDADVEAIGIGLPPENMHPVRGRALARRAAIIDAQRNLLEMMKGVQIDSETTIEDLTVTSDVVKSKVSGLVEGSRIIEEKVNNDGSYIVKLAVPLYGAKSVAAVAIPEIVKDATPHSFPSVSANYRPEPAAAKDLASYTGVIVDASGLGLKSTFSPVIYDSNGRAVYGIGNIDHQFAISHGMVDYATNLQAAVARSRAGANPLIVKAEAVRGGGNSVNPVNIVVSVGDADKILYANEKSGMLKDRAVVFVK